MNITLSFEDDDNLETWSMPKVGEWHNVQRVYIDLGTLTQDEISKLPIHGFTLKNGNVIFAIDESDVKHVSSDSTLTESGSA